MGMVSIVMGAFNEESSIAKAIESISTQTYKSWEFIIIDDCSTDKTQEIIKKYCDKDNRIRLFINSKNLGLAASLNKGISLASGNYIARMDADDISLPKRIEKQVRFLDSNKKISVVGTAAYFRSNDSADMKVIKMPETNKKINQMIFKASPFIHPTVMMRKEFMQQTKGYNSKLRRAQDYDLWLRGRSTALYHNIKEPLLIYTYQNKKMLTGFIASMHIRISNSKNIRDFFRSLYWILYEGVFIFTLFIKKFFKMRG
jgi:glycosyltransferase EpsE